MKRKIDFVGICTLIVIILVTTLLLAIVFVAIANESHKIDDGIIVDKQYDPAYTYFITDRYGVHPRYVAERYTFTITGTKDGETVRYTFEVSAQDYYTYRIGDHYTR